MAALTQRTKHKDQKESKDVKGHVVVVGRTARATGRPLVLIIVLAAQQFCSQCCSWKVAVAPWGRMVLSHVGRCACLLRKTTLDGRVRSPYCLHSRHVMSIRNVLLHISLLTVSARPASIYEAPRVLYI